MSRKEMSPPPPLSTASLGSAERKHDNITILFAGMWRLPRPPHSRLPWVHPEVCSSSSSNSVGLTEKQHGPSYAHN